MGKNVDIGYTVLAFIYISCFETLIPPLSARLNLSAHSLSPANRLVFSTYITFVSLSKFTNVVPHAPVSVRTSLTILALCVVVNICGASLYSSKSLILVQLPWHHIAHAHSGKLAVLQAWSCCSIAYIRLAVYPHHTSTLVLAEITADYVCLS